MLPRIPGSPVSPRGSVIGSSDVFQRSPRDEEATRLYSNSRSNPRQHRRRALNDDDGNSHSGPPPAASSSTSVNANSRWWSRRTSSAASSLNASNDEDNNSNMPTSYGSTLGVTEAPTAEESTARNEEDDDDDDDSIPDLEHFNPLGDSERENASHDGDDDDEDAIALLTRRLRCLFGIVTLPIVPLGTLSCLTLLWMLYAAFILDGGGDVSCAQPMHAYAAVSLVFLLYAPYHARIRTFVFRYLLRDENSAADNGNPRPASVRRYDQIFHTMALFYVYGGITLVSTCRDDWSNLVENSTTTTISTDNEEGLQALENASSENHESAMNACQATCPHLYPALRVYVATLEVFTFSLILPLLFLPCLYLYFIRRTMADAEALAVLQDRLRDEEALLRNGGVTAEEIMEQLEEVKLYIMDASNSGRGGCSSGNHAMDRQGSISSSSGKILVVRKDEKLSPLLEDNDSNSQQQQQSLDECRSKECCICMENFSLHAGHEFEDDNGDTALNHDDCDNDDDIETGYSSLAAETTRLLAPHEQQHHQQQQHDSSVSSSSGSEDDPNASMRTMRSRIDHDRNSSSRDDSHVIVRGVKCGHLFHKRCIASWVGGRWESDTPSNSNESSRRARRTTCPLCRQDLRPDR